MQQRDVFDVHVVSNSYVQFRANEWLYTFQKADLAAAPMYATSQRATFVDFTTTFMDVYATILLRRTSQQPTINSLEVSLPRSPAASVDLVMKFILVIVLVSF